ncbi:uncharacterized protein [Diadema setosum]|uniref:uncharacterized protein n=1 Tax=Diadema setosum TaxID=31175 RepID=UPI003B3A22B3
MVYGCSNTYQDGYFMHNMPGKMPGENENYSAHQKAWLNFIAKKRKLETKDFLRYQKISICSGHFTLEDYKTTEVQMFRRGIRSKTPSLNPEAVPTVVDAVHPFPPSWFIPAALASPLPVAETASTSSSGLSYSREAAQMDEAEHPSEAGQRSSGTKSSSLKRKRSDSNYIRRQEVNLICSEHDRKVEGDLARERAKDIFDRSKGEQCSVKMRDHKVGGRRKGRTCKIQVRQITCDKGSQAGVFMKPTKQGPVVLYSDAAVQTTESSFSSQDEETEATSDDFEVVDDESKDPVYRPSDDLPSEEDIEAVHKQAHPDNILEEGKYIVFERNLISLFETCLTCLSKKVIIEKVQPQSYGSQLKIQATCESCGAYRQWYSQPKMGTVMAGNLLLSSAILFGGASPTKVIRVLGFMNLKGISLSTFMEHQSTYLQPTIIRVWERKQRELIRRVREKEIILGGDGRADSPGHSAKYGAYTLMDMESKKVLNIQLVQSNEVTSSNAMEKEGLVRGLAELQESGVKVKALVIDRHSSVAKWMREEHPDIKHHYDIWHIAKGMQKKITAISKLKDCDVAGLWKQSIIRHVYWAAASTQDGNGEMIAAKYASIFNHIRNVHHHDGIFKRCEHAEDYPQREWMKEAYVEELMHEAMNLVTRKLRLRSDIPALEGKAPLCSKHQRVDKDEAVRLAKANRRFNEFE